MADSTSLQLADSLPSDGQSDGQSGQWLAWWQLLRAGNVFTAVSNVIAGFLVMQTDWQPVGPLLMLVLSSMLLYEAGMVLNDAFDAEFDAVDRPERPIPSGRISRRAAFVVGWLLLAGGTLSAWLVSWLIGSVAPAVVGSSLAITIVMYDSGLKKNWAGPLAMGWCRLLNVLLGASIAAIEWGSRGIWWFAIGVGLYTVGITLLAKGETANRQKATIVPFVVVIIGLSTISRITTHIASQHEASTLWFVWVLLASCVVGQAFFLKRQSSPSVVQKLVKQLLLAFIVIDAIVATGAAGWMSGLAVLCLLIPTLIASRWAPMT